MMMMTMTMAGCGDERNASEMEPVLDINGRSCHICKGLRAEWLSLASIIAHGDH